MSWQSVSEETIVDGGFNWWEPTCTFRSSDNRFCTAYHSKVPDTDGNVVAVDAVSPDCVHCWYVAVFAGPDSGECATDEEARPFYQQLYGTVDDKNLVALESLEEAVVAAIERARTYPYVCRDR